jgi:hypothetical protein
LWNLQKSWDPSPIEVDKSDELANHSDGGQALPNGNYRGLLIVHLEPIPTNINAQELEF